MRWRTFREVEVGVPIFAALDGVVTAARDGEPDRNTSGEQRPSNFVAIDHGGGHTVPSGYGASVANFFFAHPFGTEPSPYAEGLPADFPADCSL